MNRIKRKFDVPMYTFINKRPYELVHKIKESWAEEDIDEEGYVHYAFYYSKTLCGLKLIHDKWDNTRVSEMSYNCERCMSKER